MFCVNKLRTNNRLLYQSRIQLERRKGVLPQGTLNRLLEHSGLKMQVAHAKYGVRIAGVSNPNVGPETNTINKWNTVGVEVYISLLSGYG